MNRSSIFLLFLFSLHPIICIGQRVVADDKQMFVIDRTEKRIPVEGFYIGQSVNDILNSYQGNSEIGLIINMNFDIYFCHIIESELGIWKVNLMEQLGTYYSMHHPSNEYWRYELLSPRIAHMQKPNCKNDHFVQLSEPGEFIRYTASH